MDNNNNNNPANNGTGKNTTDSVDSPSGLRHRIFAGNLDFSTTKEQLYEAFSKCGKIVDEIRLHPGYAFIQFESEDSCRKAISTLSGSQLCSKRIDVQMAKGPNNSQKNKEGTKRKLDDRGGSNNNNRRDDRGGGKNNNNNDYRNNNNNNRNNKKQKRYDDDNHQRSSVGVSNTSQAITLPPTVSPYSSVALSSIPIYIPNLSLEKFANTVLQTMKSNGLAYHYIHIRNTNQGEYFFATPQFMQMVASERFVICVTARHEEAKNIVSFKAIMPDGTCPGFADTSITDVCTFILNSSIPPPIQSSPYQYASTLTTPTLPTMTTSYPNVSASETTTSYHNNNSGGNNRNNTRPSRNNNNRRNDNNRGGKYYNNNNNASQVSPSLSNEHPPQEEVKGLIMALLDTINKKKEGSNVSSPGSIVPSQSSAATQDGMPPLSE